MKIRHLVNNIKNTIFHNSNIKGTKNVIKKFLFMPGKDFYINPFKKVLNKIMPPKNQGIIKEHSQMDINIASSKVKDQSQNDFVFVTGLRSLTLSHLEAIKKNCEYKLIYILCYQKCIYYNFSPEHLLDDIFVKISNSFLILNEYGKISKDPEVDLYFRNNWVSIIQHILNFIYVGKKFKKINLQKMAPEIDLTFYDDYVPFSVLIEVYICLKNVKDITHNKKIIAINPENIFLNEIGSLHDKSLCEEQIHQKNGDFLFLSFQSYQDLKGDFGIKMLRTYKDVKADMKSTIKGSLTMKPYLHTEQSVFNMYINNYISLLKNLKTDVKCLDLLESLLDIKKDKKKTIIEKLNAVNIEIFQFSLAEKGLNFALAVDSGGIDIEVNIFMKEIMENLNKKQKEFDILQIFPSTNKVSISQAKNITLHLASLLPPEKSNRILENLLEWYNHGEI